jgi:hypothetical protein
MAMKFLGVCACVAALGLVGCGEVATHVVVSSVLATASVGATAAREADANGKSFTYRVHLQDDRGHSLDGVTVLIMRHRYRATGASEAAWQSVRAGEVISSKASFDQITLDASFVADRTLTFSAQHGVAAVSVLYSKPGYVRQLYVYNKGGNEKATWLELPRSPDRWVDVRDARNSVVYMIPEVQAGGGGR